jgi:uncharacterized membrane protein
VVAISSANSENKFSLRWTYVVLPVSILLISVILTAVFYRLLPDEVAYRFSGGEPSHEAGRGGVIAWVIGLQLVFALVSLAITYMTTSASRRLQIDETDLNRSLFSIMGNLMALPQVILLFAMLDIFLYNAYQIKLIPLWVFALIVLVLGGVILGVYFVRTIRKSRRQQGKSLRE